MKFSQGALLVLFAACAVLPESVHSEVGNCLSRRWENQNCRIESFSASPYAEMPEYLPSYWAGLGQEALEFNEAVRDALNSREQCSDLRALADGVQGIAERAPLSGCQKACLVRCITAQYIEYDESLPLFDLQNNTACSVARTGSANCRAYAALSDFLLDRLGVVSNSVSGIQEFNLSARSIGGHAYSRFRETPGDPWLYFEPQNPECRFYTVP